MDRLKKEMLRISGETFSATWIEEHQGVLLILYAWATARARAGDDYSLNELARWLKCVIVECAGLLRDQELKGWKAEGGIVQ